MGLSDYLAKNYLSASTAASSDPSDTRPTKKRKKNKQAPTESLVIADDDDLLLSSNLNQVDDENDTPMYYDSKVRSAEFRKSKQNAWKTLDGSNAEKVSQPEDEADKLLRETIASTAQARADLDAESTPMIVDTNDGDTTTSKMSSGIKAGLQTAADTERLLLEEEARQLAEERAATKSRRSNKKEKDPEAETIYRDATGRRIDLNQRRAEIRKAEASKIAAEKQAREDAMGEVQLRQKQARKQELEDAKFLTLGRSVEDVEYNESLKEKVHWDDPMAAYMASNSASKQVEGGGDREGGDVVRRPEKKEYQGAAPPNRYGIKPGWRWDGVDRGNGFEREWFQARGKKARVEKLEYQWQMDE